MQFSSGKGTFMRQQLNKRRTDTLDYMQSMLGQLRNMAEAERCDMLAYLVEMAYVEVSDILRGERPLRVQDKGHRPTDVPFEPTGKIKFQ
ncbi:hypothetical protein [Mesorhizobium sp. CAU 1741]|uniref:hypothetical protein n=1 Tax=Mesorhizobium sp. CAU 1741 TaxID=3140366 RepID=UPI00325A742D